MAAYGIKEDATETNEARVLASYRKLLRNSNGRFVTQAEVARDTGLLPTTVQAATARLKRSGDLLPAKQFRPGCTLYIPREAE